MKELVSNVFNKSKHINTGKIQIGTRTKCQTNVDDSMTIDKILKGHRQTSSLNNIVIS